MKIEVTEGQIRLSSIQTVIDTPDVKIIDVDAKSKYYDIGGYSEDNVEAIQLYPHEGTLRTDESADFATSIEFIFEDDERWEISTGGSAKYGFRITLVRTYPDRMGTIIWADED